MTGHLVLTTLHTHNAASSIARLKDMGVEPSLLATSINCIVAQRLARRLCLDCREPYRRPPRSGRSSGSRIRRMTFRSTARTAASGARGTGYRGRVALYEVMPVHGPSAA